MNQYYNLLSLNVNSLIGHERRLSLLNLIKYHKSDINFICETKLKTKHRVQFKEFNVIRNDDGGGTAIILHESIKFEKINFSSNVFSICLVNIPLINDGGTRRSFLIGSIYIPTNAGTSLTNELDRLYNITNVFDYVAIGGDFNARNNAWGDTKCNRNGKIIFNWLNSGSVLSLSLLSPSSPTFVRTEAFLDHFLLSSELTMTSNGNKIECQTTTLTTLV